MPGIALPEPERISSLVERFGGAADDALSERAVTRVVAPEDAATENDLVVVVSPRFVSRALDASGVLLTNPELAGRLPSGRRWVHPHADWALAAVLELAAPTPESTPSRASTAVVEPGAVVAEDVTLGAFSFVASGARVGRGSVIGQSAVVLGGVSLGERVVVGASAVLGRPGFGWVTGPEGQLRRVPQLGGVVVEDDVEIGALCTVDAGTLGPTRIGRGTKLDAQVHVGHNVRIGPGCVVAAQVGFAGSVRLGAGVLVGGQAGFKDHVSVGDGARVAAKSGVIGDVPDQAVVAGFPAVPRARWLRAMARLLGRKPMEEPR